MAVSVRRSQKSTVSRTARWPCRKNTMKRVFREHNTLTGCCTVQEVKFRMLAVSGHNRF